MNSNFKFILSCLNCNFTFKKQRAKSEKLILWNVARNFELDCFLFTETLRTLLYKKKTIISCNIFSRLLNDYRQTSRRPTITTTNSNSYNGSFGDMHVIYSVYVYSNLYLRQIRVNSKFWSPSNERPWLLLFNENFKQTTVWCVVQAMRPILFTILLLKFLHVVQNHNILGIFPLQSTSHYVMFERLLKTLAAEGHDVDVISHFPQQEKIPR